jgi:hypothetical protein
MSATAPKRGPGPPVDQLLAEAAMLVEEARAAIAAPAPTAGLALTPAETDQIAVALGLGARPTAGSILAAIDRLAAVRIGDIRVPFTPGQLSELQQRAAKRGRTVEAELQAVVARIQDELFYKGG